MVMGWNHMDCVENCNATIKRFSCNVLG